MVDDSIVRGTTSRRIVQLLKEAGATEVHVAIGSPAMTAIQMIPSWRFALWSTIYFARPRF